MNGIYEKSLTLSCPEAARVALLNSKSMEFYEENEELEVQNIIAYELNTDDIRYSNKIRKYFWNLRICSITLIQNRDYKLWERVIILGLFLRKVQRTVDDKIPEEITMIVNQYNEVIENGSLRTQLENIPTNFAIQMKLMKEFNDERLNIGLNPNTKAYAQCFNGFLEGIQYTKEATVEEIAERYNQAYQQYYKPFMDEHDYILENYLVNYVFENMFPISSKEGAFNDYVKLVVNY